MHGRAGNIVSIPAAKFGPIVARAGNADVGRVVAVVAVVVQDNNRISFELWLYVLDIVLHGVVALSAGGHVVIVENQDIRVLTTNHVIDVL